MGRSGGKADAVKREAGTRPCGTEPRDEWYGRVARYIICWQVRTLIGPLCGFGVDTSSCLPCYALAQRGYELGRSGGYTLAHGRL